MDNEWRNIFDKIHAEEALKRKTTDFLHEKIQRRRGRSTVQFKLAAVCASFILLLIISGFSYNLYFAPSAYVDIDVNPAIELVVNRFGKVVEANPYNDDGASILTDINVRRMSYEAAIDKLIGAMAAGGYLKQDATVSATVQSDDGSTAATILGGLQKAINNSLQTHHASAASDIFVVSGEVKKHSHENHVTPAKYIAISQLQQVDPTATIEGCREHTISEINEMIREHGGKHHGNGTSGNGTSDDNAGYENTTDNNLSHDDSHEQGKQAAENRGAQEGHSSNATPTPSQVTPKNRHESGSGHGNDKGHGSGRH